MMNEIILHHYDASPFSEKVRLAFGLKNLAWRSVQISNIMPRPDLMPMTGGYRRTPVLQIGAEIFCDTQCILWALEQRFPDRTLYPNREKGAAWMLTQWADRAFFQASVAVIFGGLPEGAIDEAFIRDREELSGRAFDMEAMKAAAPRMIEQWRTCAHLVEAQLEAQAATSGSYLFGGQPGLGDLSAHMNFWFLRSASKRYPEIMAELPRTSAWVQSMDEIGHGEQREMSTAEALEIARDATPDIGIDVDSSEPNGLSAGQKLGVMPDDYGRVPVLGELVSSSPWHIAIKRQNEIAGEVIVYFPRLGYLATPV